VCEALCSYNLKQKFLCGFCVGVQCAYKDRDD
jgi:hypothetical protein